MELNQRLVGNANVEYIIAQIRRRYKAYQKDIVAACNLVCELNSVLTERTWRRFETAATAFRYMEPTPEDIISILLFPEYRRGKITSRIFLHHFSEKRADLYFTQIVDAHQGEKRYDDEGKAQEDEEARENSIGYRVLMRICDKMFRRMMRAVNGNGIPNAILITSAYNTARSAHYGIERLPGVPYMVRPVRIATVLVNAGAESAVVAAALLREALVESRIEADELHKSFGRKVADCVQAVSTLEREYANAHEHSDDQNGKPELNAVGFKRVMRLVGNDADMKAALYIKGAECICALGVVDGVTTAENARRTPDYLPLLKAFDLRYFVYEIENLTWRSADVARYDRMLSKYEDMFSRNWQHLDSFARVLSGAAFVSELNGYAALYSSDGYDIEVKKRKLLPYDIYQCIGKKETVLADPAKQIGKRTVPLCDLDIVFSPRDVNATYDLFIPCFLKAFESRIAEAGRAVADFEEDCDGNKIFVVEDRYRNVYRCRVIRRDAYEAQKIGAGAEEEMGAAEMPVRERGRGADTISVYLRNGQKIQMPKGATVIDVAFAIHEEIGFTVKSAVINDRPVSIFNMLADGDRVIVDADTCREDGITQRFVRHVRINWLNWVVTERARKKIIAFLSDKYEGDDPRYENKAQTSVVESIADSILEDWNPVQ